MNLHDLVSLAGGGIVDQRLPFKSLPIYAQHCFDFLVRIHLVCCWVIVMVKIQSNIITFKIIPNMCQD